MDHSKDLLALLENMQNQIHDLKQEKDAQQQQQQQQQQQILAQQQQILDEKKQRQQLADELHDFKATTSKKPLSEKSSLMKHVFIFITFLAVCDAVFVIAYLVASFLGFYNSLALQLFYYFFACGGQIFALTWFVCFAPSPKWLLSLFILLSLVFVVETIIWFVTVNVVEVAENVVCFIICSLMAWQYQSLWRILSARPLEQETPKLFLSLFRTFVFLSIPIVAISVRDQELNEYAGYAIRYFSYTSLGLVGFVRVKIENNESLLQLLFRLNYKEQVCCCLVPIGYALFLIDYLYYLSNSLESSAVQLCVQIVTVVLIILVALFIVGTVSKWKCLSWFDIDNPVAASEESNVELSHHLDHVTIDF